MHRQCTCLFIIFALFFSFLSFCPSKAEDAPVRVGYFEAGNIISGATDSAQKSGFVYDYLQIIAGYTGWTYEYIYGDFDNLLNKLYSSEIDLMPDITYLPERAESILYPELSLFSEEYFICSTSEKIGDDMSDYSLLQGKRIGTTKGMYQLRLLNEWMEKEGVSLDIVEYSSIPDIWSDMESGALDLSLEISVICPSYLEPIVFLGASDTYLAVSEDRPDLLNALNQAQRYIIESNPYLIDSLSEKYFRSKLSVRALTEEELAWVGNHGRLIVGSLENDRPFSFLNTETGEPDGVIINLLSMMLERLNITDLVPEVRLYSSLPEMRNALKSGELDLIFPEYCSYSDAESNDLYISNKVLSVNMSMAYEDDFSPETRNIIATPGTHLGIYFTRDTFPDSVILPCNSAQECIQAILDGRATAAIAHNNAIKRAIKPYVRLDSYVLNALCDICFASSRNTPVLIRLVNRGISLVTEDELNIAILRYTKDTAVPYTARDFFKDNFFLLILLAVILFLLIILVVVLGVARGRNRRQLQVIQNAKCQSDEQLQFLDGLCREYKTVLLIHSKDHSIHLFRSFTQDESMDLNQFVQPDARYEDNIERYIDSCVPVSEHKALKEAVRFDHVLEMLPEAGLYTVNYSRNEKDGTVRYHQMCFAKAASGTGKTDFLIAFRDITHIILREREQQDMLRSALDRAESASRAQSDLLSTMSHDIRTPINGIMGLLEIEKKHLSEPKRLLDCIEKTAVSCRNLLSLFNDILDVNKIESGKMELHYEPMDMQTLNDGIVTIIEEMIEKRSLRFIHDFNIWNPHVIGDEVHLQRLLINVLENAIKFTPNGGTITYSIHEVQLENGRLEFVYEIKDTGIGISPNFIDHIWDYFAQEDNGIRTTFKGTGLGLPITRRLVVMLGGKITVNSQVGQGTVFTITIPFNAAQQTTDNPMKLMGRDTIRGMHILVADDNELNREVISEFLIDEGAIITTATNGSEAVHLFADSQPNAFDAILIDIKMPVMDGLEATRYIRAMDRPDAAIIPIIGMTANSFSEGLEKYRNAGLNHQLFMPLDFVKLINTLSPYNKSSQAEEN